MPTQCLDTEDGQPAIVDCRSQDAKSPVVSIGLLQIVRVVVVINHLKA